MRPGAGVAPRRPPKGRERGPQPLQVEGFFAVMGGLDYKGTGRVAAALDLSVSPPPVALASHCCSRAVSDVEAAAFLEPVCS